MTADLTAPQFTDENAAREHLEALRWPNGVSCPHCGSLEGITKLQGKSHRPGLWLCGACRKTVLRDGRHRLRTLPYPVAQVAAGDASSWRPARRASAPISCTACSASPTSPHGSWPPHPRSHGRRPAMNRWAAMARPWKPTKPISATRPANEARGTAHKMAVVPGRARRRRPLVPHRQATRPISRRSFARTSPSKALDDRRSPHYERSAASSTSQTVNHSARRIRSRRLRIRTRSKASSRSSSAA